MEFQPGPIRKQQIKKNWHNQSTFKKRSISFISVHAQSEQGNLTNFVEVSIWTLEIFPKNFRAIPQRLIILQTSL